MRPPSWDRQSPEFAAIEAEMARIHARREQAGSFAAAPNLRRDEPLSSVWKTPADCFEAQARALRTDPERVADAEEVRRWLHLLLAHEVSHVEFDHAVPGRAIFNAIRVWGPFDSDFAAMMPVLDARMVRRGARRAA